jgi:hypothetical protein
MRADPYDDLLLTNRRTTVVTEPTRMLNTCPDMAGASEDEEALFAGIGADPAAPPVTVAPNAAVAAGAVAPAAVATGMGMVKTLAVAGLGLWLVSKVLK